MQLLLVDTETIVRIQKRKVSIMNNITININEAAVTAIHEFNSIKGYGVDFYIEAKSSNGTVYFQIVTYDNEARSYCRYIHEGDYVRVTGELKTKPYRKKDGTEGLSLLIERPVLFSKIASSNSKPQFQQQAEKSIETESSEEQNQDKNAVTADDTSYYEKFKDYSDIENPWEYAPEELEKIFRHIEEYKKQTRTSLAADTALQELHTETASQYKPESSYSEDSSGKTQYPPTIPEDEDDMPF